jgi:hypothetical protein
MALRVFRAGASSAGPQGFAHQLETGQYIAALMQSLRVQHVQRDRRAAIGDNHVR